MLPGFIIEDLAWQGVLSRVILLRIQNEILPEYEVDPWASLSYNLYSLYVIYSWNILVEKDILSFKRWAWGALAFFSFFFGLFLITFNF